MSETLLLALLNSVQVIFLGYLTYRERTITRAMNGHLSGHGDD